LKNVFDFKDKVDKFAGKYDLLATQK